MDNAVALVQAYLRVNGYFTVSEYPVLEARPANDHRTVTDLDILAFRFAGAGRLTGEAPRASVGGLVTSLDPALGADPDQADMIVGEVKEGRPVLNDSARSPEVVSTALIRFGCCPPKRRTAS